ncbi:MAG: L-2-amino-thiazoline-4-carboxylic acid hydrolase [Gemmiger sp.]|nr:L-2-amino-thiazoline-4-carboxylic acid hydrolase [Gemmiger sp.]
MNYTGCEWLLWAVLSGPTFRYIKNQKPEWNMRGYQKRTKKIYGALIARTPGIGTLKENPLRMCLSGGAVWFAAFEAADGQMSESMFADMVAQSMKAPILQWSFQMKKKSAFSRSAQKKSKQIAELANASHSPCNWQTELTLGRDADEYTKIYHACGLCGLGRQEKLFYLVKYTCVLDYASVELMGGTLFRTQTLANGANCCDFYICRKGSRWEAERKKKGEELL